MFTINGIDWNLRLVGSHSPMLMRSDGTYTFGMTDRNTRDIYISNMIHGNFYDRVLCHELCHAFCLSYNLTMDIQTEEIVADFLATYGREVFALADELSALSGVKLPQAVETIRTAPVLHNRVVDAPDMPKAVKDILGIR